MQALSLAHLTVLEVAPPALFDLAARAGFQSVGVRIVPVAPGAPCYPLTRRGVLEWRRRMADAGVGVHDVEFIALEPQVRVDDYASSIALAAELGARRVNVSGDDADFDRLAGRFGALCDLAAAVGMGVDLEFMRFRSVGNLPQALDVIARAGRPNGRLLVDLLHLFRSGGTAEMLRRVAPGALGSVQICDAPHQDPGDAGLIDEARQGRLFPGQGELPLLAMLDALPAAIPLAVEVPCGRTQSRLTTEERATKACAATRQLLGASRPSR